MRKVNKKLTNKQKKQTNNGVNYTLQKQKNK